MSVVKIGTGKPPRRMADLVRELLPQAIQDNVAYQNSLEMIDRLMAVGKHTRDQALYLETLVQLVEAYEAAHHSIDASGVTGLRLLRHLLVENDMNASDLARLLGVHPSMGSKILQGDRALTVAHAKALARRFKVRFDVFLAG